MEKTTHDEAELPEPSEIEDMESGVAPDETPQPARKFQRVRRRRSKWTLLTGGIFVVLLVVGYTRIVPPLPRGWQLLAALFDSLLAGLVVHFAFAEYGRRLKRIKMPRIAGKKIHPKKPGTLAGWAAVAAVFVLWMTPLAPVRVDYITAADLLAEFTAEVTQATLIQPHERLAVLQRPIPPRSAVDAARDIPDDADSFRLALREMANGRFQNAREYLDEAVPQGEVTEAMIRRARPLIDLYDGKYQRAAGGYEKALAAEPKDFHLACQTAAALTHAASTTEDFGKAEKLAEDLRSRAAEGSEKMTATNLLAAIYICQGKLQAARGLWADPDQEATKTPQGGTLNNQGVLNANLANYDVAEIKFRDAISAWRERWSDSWRWNKVDVEIHVGPGVLNQGVGLYDVGKYNDAEDKLRSVLEEKFDGLPENHSAKGVAAAALAMLYFEQGRLEMVEPLIGQASKRFDIKNTETHTLATRFLSARLAAARGRFVTAMLFYSSLLSEVSDRLSSSHPFAADVRHQMAMVLLLQAADDSAAGDSTGAADRLKNAAQQCDQAIKIVESYSISPSLRAGHWAADRVRITLARVLVAQNKSIDASKELKKAEKSLTKALGKDHLALADLLAAQAEAKTGTNRRANIARLGMYEQAIEAYIQALGKEHGEAHPTVARWRYQLARNQFSLEKYAEAKSSLDDAVNIQEEKQPRHPHYADSLRLRAQVLRKIDADDSTANDDERLAIEVFKKHEEDEVDSEQGN
ncbi:MAG: tetratricopeptide repeat protein [Planctomycetes bacterium]|nr:tetratricopeptide repeat protein [Planctomycetota bacterium]